MDRADAETLTHLLRGTRIAHLATLRDGKPMASMTLFLATDEGAAFHVHISRLAWHTQDMAGDTRVALSIAETDDAREDPFTLARLTVRGTAEPLPGAGAAFETLKAQWLAKFPAQAVNFTLADFSFWRILPMDARFIAGYGRIYNLSAQALREAIEAHT
ncbi:MAG TPA: pyridoxamine 5'-phosphate oxidase family protein [Burkholderiales bacterium]